MKKLIFFVLGFLSINVSFGADIDLYLGDSATRTGNRPQVLIIFDNSGSMSTNLTVKESYNPDVIYPAVGGLSSLSDKFIYFTKGAGIDNSSLVPDSPSESHRFLDAINSCATARESLNTVGFYTGHIREYSFKGSSGSWQQIPDNSGANISIIDCEDDVKQIPANPDVNAGIETSKGTVTSLPKGYPIDGLGSKGSPIYYTKNAIDSNVSWSGEVVTLYSDNYLRWSHNTAIAMVSSNRMAVAKEAISNLIKSAPSVDFGLQIFNLDYPLNERDGGRVIDGIKEMTDSNRTILLNTIDSLTPQTNTPLCETLYEARNYFGGLAVQFGDDDKNYSSWYKANHPPRDTNIETVGKVYIPPYTTCSNEVFIILVTDGAPTMDGAADNDIIRTLPGIGTEYSHDTVTTCSWYGYLYPCTFNITNYLPNLAGWMHTHDLNTSLPGKQISTLFTIGFGKDAVDSAGHFLNEAAKQGGGKYFAASDPSSLLNSLQSAIAQIAQVDATFTAPSVATNNFDRTQTLDSVYYAMFLPDRGPRWQGNIKKLKVVNGVQVDRDGVAAINSKGNIADTAKTYWSTLAADGNKVSKGGVAEMLRNKTNRVFFSDLGTGGSLVPLTTINASSSFGSATALATDMKIPEVKIDDYFNWAKGVDVDDANGNGSVTDIRPDVFGDPLHSKPLVVNYGGSSTSQDVRIIVGTNAGTLHMFKDNGNTVDESWALMPKEFFKNIKNLRANFTSTSKIYGIDGSATLYTLDNNGDGSIVSADGDKAWIFFGLRRGGDSYYGIDISNPDMPKLLWHINSSTTGFSELGQTWSKPKVAFSALNIVSGIPKPVLIFGGGYDISKDSSGIGSNDSVGRAVYMVDAETGSLKWSMSPAAKSSINTHFAGTDSIPSAVGILDSNSDGLTDRVYVGDTGGNVWRIDMPGNNPSSATKPWTVFKLAELGGTTNLSDRRFFSEPSIVRTIISDTKSTTNTNTNGVTTTMVTRQKRPYDAILIGSGDRSTPLATDTNDKFFMIRDPNIVTKSYTGTSTALIPSSIIVNDLYDYTNDPFGQTLTSQQRDALEIAVTSKSGWFIDLTGSGEKSTASAIAIDGFAYFTSFQPAIASVSACQVDPVSGFLYSVDLALGTRLWINNVQQADKKILTTTGTIETPQLLITSAPVAVCTGASCPHVDKVSPQIRILAGKIIIPLGITIDTWRTYLYVTE